MEILRTLCVFSAYRIWYALEMVEIYCVNSVTLLISISFDVSNFKVITSFVHKGFD